MTKSRLGLLTPQKRYRVKVIGVGTLFEEFNMDVNATTTGTTYIVRAAIRCVNRVGTPFEVVDDFHDISITFADGGMLRIVPA